MGFGRGVAWLSAEKLFQPHLDAALTENTAKQAAIDVAGVARDREYMSVLGLVEIVVPTRPLECHPGKLGQFLYQFPRRQHGLHAGPARTG